MPRVVLSGLLQDIRGSMGGSTFSAWKGLNYLRNKAVSVANPNTDNQAKLRANFAESVADWKGLTPVQRALWEEFAQSLKVAPGKNQVVGNSGIIPEKGKTMSGMNAFIGVNQHLEGVDAPRVLVPPINPQQDAVIITVAPNYNAVTGCIELEFAAQPKPYALNKTLEVWVKGWWGGAHSYIAFTTGIPEPPVVPATVEICTIRKGWNFTVEEVPIAQLAPCEIYVQLRSIREDGRVSPPSALYKVACAP